MEFLDVTHNTGLILASVVIALVAGFTGLTLSKDLSKQNLLRRKGSVAMSAIALGGGIWSMHFVAMLGLQMPILFYYDAAVTLASALLAILIVGVALLLLHFSERTTAKVCAAGALVGCGILAMHYVGMAGLQLCRAVYTPLGVFVAAVSAIGFCIVAFLIAYGERSNRNILLGTLCFGFAVSSVHFIATFGTKFVAVPTMNEFGPVMSNETLAIGVILSSFVIFGAFLWMSVTFLVPQETEAQTAATEASVSGTVSSAQGPLVDLQDEYVSSEEPEMRPAPASSALPIPTRIPCDREGVTLLIDPADVAFVQAEGHYTHVYTNSDKHFCVWPITEATKRLTKVGFLKTHRSYLVNPAQVQHFERLKDTGVCRFEASNLPQVPVSRSNLKAVRDALGL